MSAGWDDRENSEPGQDAGLDRPEPAPFGSKRSERKGPAQAIDSGAILHRSDDSIRSGNALTDDADLIGEIGDIRRAASRFGDLGIAEFAALAAALAAVERDLAACDPDHPDGRRLRVELKARLEQLGEALRTLLNLVDRLRQRPV